MMSAPMLAPVEIVDAAPASDRPCTAERQERAVLLTVPALGSFSMTADAALETAYRLIEEALQAKRLGW